MGAVGSRLHLTIGRYTCIGETPGRAQRPHAMRRNSTCEHTRCESIVAVPLCHSRRRQNYVAVASKGVRWRYVLDVDIWMSSGSGLVVLRSLRRTRRQILSQVLNGI